VTAGAAPAVASVAAAMVAFAWAWMAVGIFVGMLFGLYAFEGPLPTPNRIGEYDSCTRRLMRLGHVAFIMLPLISMAYANQIARTSLSPDTQILAVKLCWTGMIGVPTICMTGAFWRWTKYFFSIPVVCFFTSLIMMAVGQMH
jgi:hypothetical protein